MKKFLLLMFALTILTAPVEAADVPDVRSVAPKSIVLKLAVPADENSVGVYEYLCKDDNALYYYDKYVQLLVENGFVAIDGRQQGDDIIQGFVNPDKDIPVFEFELDTPVHVLIEGTNSEIKIRTAPGISYGDE